MADAVELPSAFMLRRLDLVFCVDLTGSMGGLIAAARAHIGRVLDALAAMKIVET